MPSNVKRCQKCMITADWTLPQPIIHDIKFAQVTCKGATTYVSLGSTHIDLRTDTWLLKTQKWARNHQSQQSQMSMKSARLAGSAVTRCQPTGLCAAAGYGLTVRRGGALPGHRAWSVITRDAGWWDAAQCGAAAVPLSGRARSEVAAWRRWTCMCVCVWNRR